MAHAYGWKKCFWFMGTPGIVFTLLWVRTIDDVKLHPLINAAEIATIEDGRGLCVISSEPKDSGMQITWKAVGKLLSTRMLLGIY
jgi:ACS family glucarate transporter-like MFS transporter